MVSAREETRLGRSIIILAEQRFNRFTFNDCSSVAMIVFPFGFQGLTKLILNELVVVITYMNGFLKPEEFCN